MSSERLQVYKCEICGIIVELLEGGAGECVCCGEAMTLLPEKTAAEEGKEKHVPVVEAAEGTVTVKVGSIEHPMEEKHFIQWIEVISDGKAYREFLKPGQEPKATFKVEGNDLVVRELCNLHGLWKS